MFESISAYFLIKSGPALKAVKASIAEHQASTAANKALADELGVQNIWRSRSTGRMTGACFPRGKVHADFTKPRGADRVSAPRKGSAWAARLAALKPITPASVLLADLNIVTDLTGPNASRLCGHPFNPIGFLYCSAKGPYAFWCPDPAAELAAMPAADRKLYKLPKGFKLEFPGCERIEQEEWDIIVASFKLKARKAEERASAKV